MGGARQSRLCSMYMKERAESLRKISAKQRPGSSRIRCQAIEVYCEGRNREKQERQDGNISSPASLLHLQ